MKKRYVSTRPISGSRDSAGVGYIIVPQDQDRDAYINKCLRTGSLTLLLENGGLIGDVLVSKTILNEIRFPKDSNSIGDQLVWVNQPRKNSLIAIGCISKNNEFVNFTKDQSSLRRASDNFVSEVIVDSEKGCLIINSNSSIDSGGDIYVVSFNKDKSSKLNVIISGSINVKSENFNIENSKKISLLIKDSDVDNKITEVSYEKGVGFLYKDEFENQIQINSEKVNIKPVSKFTVGEGKEPALLSETFRIILEDLTNIISEIAQNAAAITVIPTAFETPTSPPANAASFIDSKGKLEALKNKFKDFQSKSSFLD